MKKQQSGFTLIELVMVIVILGILAAFALPKFADLSGDAEIAVCKGGLAATKSGAGIAHAAWLAGGQVAIVSTIEGGPYTMNATGYPTVTDIAAIAGMDASFVPTASGTTSVAFAVGSNNSFTYTAATGTSAATTLCN